MATGSWEEDQDYDLSSSGEGKDRAVSFIHGLATGEKKMTV